MNFQELVRLGGDAVVRYTQNEKAVLSFRAAYDIGWGDRKRTEWLDCSLWGERAEKLVEYLKKGDQCVVVGTIGTKEYEGKVSLALEVSEVKLVGGKKEERQESSRPPSRSR
jgi:single-strand DNA-binding protein